METPRPRCLYKIAHTEKNEHHWLLVRARVRSQKKDSAHCVPSFPFSRIDVPVYAPQQLFSSIFAR